VEAQGSVLFLLEVLPVGTGIFQSSRWGSYLDEFSGSKGFARVLFLDGGS